MRRIFVPFAASLLAALALVGCGSSASSGASSEVTASGTFGKQPTVTIPHQRPGGTLIVKTLIRGKGTTISQSDSFLSDFVVYVWQGTTHKLLDSTYSTGPEVLPVSLLPGIETALSGQRVGSRVLAVIPPKDGYGSAGNSQLGVTGSDTLVFVMDVLRTYPAGASASGRHVSDGGGHLPTVSAPARGTAPSVTIPKTPPPTRLVVKTLIDGTGPAVAKGDTVIVQYVGVDWRTRQVFDSSWARKTPFSFQIGASPSQVIPGWDNGLLGATVGSRVLLVIPPKDAYGTAGNPQAGITGSDTLVFVVDILGAIRPSST